MENNGDYIVINDGTQEFRLITGIHCIFADMVEKMFKTYILGCDFGDGDEGCIYVGDLRK